MHFIQKYFCVLQVCKSNIFDNLCSQIFSNYTVLFSHNISMRSPTSIEQFCSGMKMDAEGGLEFLLSREDIDRRRIIVYGRSLGITKV